MMDATTDPLADIPPPRHAIESDDEDEFNPLTSNTPTVDEDTLVEIDVAGLSVPANLPLIIVSGEAGGFWSMGASFLGSQCGSVSIHSTKIGLIWLLGKADLPLLEPPPAFVIFSEAFSRLPVWAMHPYAKGILETFKPSRVTILDTYSIPTYINTKGNPTPLDAPIRYLANRSSDSIPVLTSKAELFEAPNLLSSTSAAFLTLLATSPKPCNLVLLPSKQIYPHPPKTIEPASLETSVDLQKQGAAEAWSGTSTMQTVTQLLLDVAGVKKDGVKDWALWSPKDPSTVHMTLEGALPPRRVGDVGEGGMYI